MSAHPVAALATNLLGQRVLVRHLGRPDQRATIHVVWLDKVHELQFLCVLYDGTVTIASTGDLRFSPIPEVPVPFPTFVKP